MQSRLGEDREEEQDEGSARMEGDKWQKASEAPGVCVLQTTSCASLLQGEVLYMFSSPGAPLSDEKKRDRDIKKTER